MTAAESQAALAAAQQAKEALYQRAMEGESVTDDELLEADNAFEKAKRAANLHAAMAIGALQRAEQKAITDLRTKASELTGARDAAIDELVARASEVDQAFANTEDALDRYEAAVRVLGACNQAVIQHNEAVDVHMPARNATLRDMPLGDRPKCPQVQNFTPRKPKLSMTVRAGLGWSEKDHPIYSLEARTRQEYGRPHEKATAA
jgi:hypothetical protein